MLQIKNTLGGGKPEGMYVWKKYSYSPAVSLENPTFDYISATVSSSSSDYTFGNFSFDISIIDDWTKFFTGFVNTNGYGSNFPSDGVFHNYSDNGNWNYTVSEVNLSEGTVAIHIGGYCGDYKSEGTYKYTGTKVVSEEIKEFLDYIVSDKETAFPDGGEKGGYWYEKVVENDLSNMVKRATETIVFDNLTFASNVSSYEIGYSDVKAVMICQLSSEVSRNAAVQAFGYIRQAEDDGSNIRVFSYYYNSSGTLYHDYGSNDSLMNGSAVSFGFMAGWKYKIIIWR